MAAHAGVSRGQLATTAEPVFADVLCALDGTRGSLTAMRQALTLAGAHGSVTLLAVSTSAGSGRHRRSASDPVRVERALDVAAQLAREAGVKCARVAEYVGPPATAIVRHARDHELLAMGAPTMSWLGGLLSGGVAESVLRSCTTPLLLARPAPEEQPFGRRILVASDADSGSDRLVELGASLASQLGGGVMLVHAVGVESKARPHAIERQVHALEATLSDACEVHVEPGSASTVIAQIATNGQASLIVMGSRQLGGLRALGSISERVVHDAPCSVLVLAPSN